MPGDSVPRYFVPQFCAWRFCAQDILCLVDFVPNKKSCAWEILCPGHLVPRFPILCPNVQFFEKFCAQWEILCLGDSMPGEILCPVKTTKIVFPILCLGHSVPRDFVPTNNYFVPGRFCAQRFSAWKGDSVPQKSILCPGDFVPREILCLGRICAQWIFL